MNIIFDSNIIYQDWYLNKPNSSLLEKYLMLSKSRLFIPKIVISESFNKYREEVLKKIKTIESEKNKLNGLILPSNRQNIPFEFDLEQICNDYETAFYLRIKSLKVIQPDHTDIPHKDIVSRDLNRRRPFQESGKGYRDTLLWEVILQKIIISEEESYFISENYRDFGYKDKEELHGHLKNDLREKGFSEDSVKLFYRLDSFIRQIVKPALEPNKKAIPGLETGRFESFSISDWFKENREIIKVEVNASIKSIFNQFQELEDPTVSYIEDPDFINVDEIYELNLNSVYINFTLQADVIIDVFIFKSDYDWLSSKYPLDVQEFDWNDHYTFAQITLNLPLNMAINFNTKTLSVEQFETHSIEYEFYGFCPYCGNVILSDTAEYCQSCKRSLIQE